MKFKSKLVVGSLFLISLFSISSVSFAETSNDVQKLKDNAYTETVVKENTQGMTEEQMLRDNIFVEDNADILSKEQELEIYKINKNVFENLKDKPQIAVVTLDTLPKDMDIDKYRNKKFEELGVGQKDLDNGLLFVIAINDRPDGKQDKGYGLEVGYGLEHIITDSMKEDIVNSDAINYFRSEDYGDGVMVAVNNIKDILAHSELGDNQTAVDAQIAREERDALLAKMGSTITAVGKWLVIAVGSITSLILGLFGIKKLIPILQRKKIVSKSKEILYSRGLTDSLIVNEVLTEIDKFDDSRLEKKVRAIKENGDSYIENNLFKSDLGVVDKYKKYFIENIYGNFSRDEEYFEVIAEKNIGIDFSSLSNSYGNMIYTLKSVNDYSDKTKETIKNSLKEYTDYTHLLTIINKNDVETIVNNKVDAEIKKIISKSTNLSDIINNDLSWLVDTVHQKLVVLYANKLQKYVNKFSKFDFVYDRVMSKLQSMEIKDIGKNELLELIHQENEKGEKELNIYNKEVANKIISSLEQTDWELAKTDGVYSKLKTMSYLNYFPNELTNNQIRNILSKVLDDERKKRLVYASNESKLSNYKPYKIPSYENYLFDNIPLNLFSKQNVSSLNLLISELSKQYSTMKTEDILKYKEYQEELRIKEEKKRKKEEKRRKEDRRRREEDEERRRRNDYYNNSSSSSWSSGSSFGGSSFGGGSSGGGGFSGGW